jgi:hypothetical protein
MSLYGEYETIKLIWFQFLCFNAVPTQARAFSLAAEGTRMEQATEKELVYGNS